MSRGRRLGMVASGLGLLGLAGGVVGGAWLLDRTPAGAEARLLLWHVPIWLILGSQFLVAGQALLRGRPGAERRLRAAAWLVALELLMAGVQYTLAWPTLVRTDAALALAWRTALVATAGFGLALLALGVRALPRA